MNMDGIGVGNELYDVVRSTILPSYIIVSSW